MSDDITTGEIGRRLDALTVQMTSLLNKLDERPSWMDIKRLENSRDASIQRLEDSLDKEQKAQDKAIKDLEDSSTWLFRAVGGTVIVGLVGIAISIFDAGLGA